VPRHASAQQRNNLVDDAINRAMRVIVSRLTLDLGVTPQVDNHQADERVSSANGLADRNIHTADESLVPGDSVKKPVFRVRPNLVSDSQVFARNGDPHTTGQASCEPQAYVVRSYAFILRQSVTVLT
jgi:hypothetical protein